MLGSLDQESGELPRITSSVDRSQQARRRGGPDPVGSALSVGGQQKLITGRESAGGDDVEIGENLQSLGVLVADGRPVGVGQAEGIEDEGIEDMVYAREVTDDHVRAWHLAQARAEQDRT